MTLSDTGDRRFELREERNENIEKGPTVGGAVLLFISLKVIQPLFISPVAKVDGKELRFDADRTGFSWKAERRIEGKDTMMWTSCKMERPQWRRCGADARHVPGRSGELVRQRPRFGRPACAGFVSPP